MLEKAEEIRLRIRERYVHGNTLAETVSRDLPAEQQLAKLEELESRCWDEWSADRRREQAATKAKIEQWFLWCLGIAAVVAFIRAFYIQFSDKPYAFRQNHQYIRINSRRSRIALESASQLPDRSRLHMLVQVRTTPSHS